MNRVLPLRAKAIKRSGVPSYMSIAARDRFGLVRRARVNNHNSLGPAQRIEIPAHVRPLIKGEHDRRNLFQARGVHTRAKRSNFEILCATSAFSASRR